MTVSYHVIWHRVLCALLCQILSILFASHKLKKMINTSAFKESSSQRALKTKGFVLVFRIGFFHFYILPLWYIIVSGNVSPADIGSSSVGKFCTTSH
jgi:hypothetical protein